jgi:flagellar hook-basal body complex protein FliE
MNILSAIRQYTSPGLEGLPLPKPDLKGTGPSAIPLQELQELPPVIPQTSVSGPGEGNGSFGNMLGRFVEEVNDKQHHASAVMQGLVKGEHVSLHQAMIAMEEASVSFQLMTEVRNKLLESYQELMRMQI